jgi:hypothetical protein
VGPVVDASSPAVDADVVITAADTTWNSGSITGPLTIPAGATVTISPGSVIQVAPGATITVKGTLQSSSALSHARVTGQSWGGIVVAGGTLKLDGVDLENPADALKVMAMSPPANYADGAITGSSMPFDVDVGGVLNVSRASVTGTIGYSQVGGTLTASRLSYDSNGNEGFRTYNVAASISVEDSTLYGHGPSGDMFVITFGTMIHVAYTEIHRVHCAFHFNTVTSFDISFMSIHDNAYGFMMYGSDVAGTRTVATSNIVNSIRWGVDEGTPMTMNGAITVRDGYWAMNGDGNINITTFAISVVNMSTTTPVAGTGPRP